MELQLEETATATGQTAVWEEWQVRLTEYFSFSWENTDFNIVILWNTWEKKAVVF